MAHGRQDWPLPNPLGDKRMITDNDSTPTGTSVSLTCRTNFPNPAAMSRIDSGAGSLRLPFCIRHLRQPTASEKFKAQLSYTFRYLYATLQETKVKFDIDTKSFSEGAREAYAFLQLTESRLARDETIVEAGLLKRQKALEIVEGEMKKEQQQFRTEVMESFRFQQARGGFGVRASEVRERILKKKVLALSEQLEAQRQEWATQSKKEDDNIDRKLEEQKLAVATELKKQREKTALLFAKQTSEMKEAINDLLRQLHSQMAAYSILSTEFDDSNPGLSSQGRQRNPSIPPDGIEKKSASTPRNDKGKGVDRGDGINQPPPPQLRNTGGDPDPDDDADNDSEEEDV